MPDPEEKPPKISILGFVLLSLLARGAKSGYQLATILKAPATLIWPARHSQIYPELSKLEKARYVIHDRVEQESRPDKKVFEITEDGLSALKTWAAGRSKPWAPRMELALRAHLMWMLEAEETASFLDDEIVETEAEIEQLWGRWEQFLDVVGDDLTTCQPGSQEFSTYAVYKLAVTVRQAKIDWCRWVKEETEAAKG